MARTFEIKQNMVMHQGEEPRTYDVTAVYIAAISEAIGFQRQRTNATPMIRDLPNIDRFTEHIEFLISNTFLSYITGNLKQQVVGIPMGTNVAPEIANLTLYADEAEFIDELMRRGER